MVRLLLAGTILSTPSPIFIGPGFRLNASNLRPVGARCEGEVKLAGGVRGNALSGEVSLGLSPQSDFWRRTLARDIEFDMVSERRS